MANAIDDWEQFRQQGVPVILHHSRYADEDRAWLDAQVLGVIGLGGQRRGVVIVGTQTLEQSLDIDADLLVTDACPADVLLQRLGRLYRHRAGTPLALLIHPEPWETLCRRETVSGSATLALRLLAAHGADDGGVGSCAGG